MNLRNPTMIGVIHVGIGLIGGILGVLIHKMIDGQFNLSSALTVMAVMVMLASRSAYRAGQESVATSQSKKN